MNLTTALLMALIPLVAIPPLIWFRQKIYNRRKQRVSTQCTRCGAYNNLEKLANYECENCGEYHTYFDASGNQLKGLETYDCQYCGAENLKGILTCTACGSANRRGIPFKED